MPGLGSSRKRRPLVAVVAVAVVVAGGVVAVVAYGPSGGEATVRRRNPEFVRGSQTVATYSYAKAVRESVLVTTPLDSDKDGRRDRVSVDLVRPREAAQDGVKVPVIMHPSPYFHSEKISGARKAKAYDAAGTVTSFAKSFHDNYFVPRGYAVMQVDLPGTNRSDGCVDIGGPVEIASVVAVVDWLNGRASATYRDGRPAVATWSTGKVGIIGKSWDGSTANAVASTGVPGLATIVPIAAISSWYDYVVFDGALGPGEDPTGLLDEFTQTSKTRCSGVRQAQRAAAGASGDYNAFWSQRDYRPKAGKVTASVFAVHGLGDLNVTPSQVATWWSALGQAKVPRKLWLSRHGHSDPFNYRRTAWVAALHRWFDHWLHGLPNGVMTEPAVSVQQTSGRWVEETSWPATGHGEKLSLGTGDGTTGTLGGTGTGTRSFTDVPELTEAAAVTEPTRAKAGRLVFLSGPLRTEARISGVPSVTLRVRVNRPTTGLTARLVDYGEARRINSETAGDGIHQVKTRSCVGESTPADNACEPDFADDVATRDLAVVTGGWLDAAHHTSLNRTTPLAPDRWYPVTVPFQATDAVLPAGHVLGLVLTATDAVNEKPASTGATISVDLAGSHLDLPVGGTSGLPRDVSQPPAVTGRDAPARNGRLSL